MIKYRCSESWYLLYQNIAVRIDSYCAKTCYKRGLWVRIYLISQKWLEKKLAEKTIKIISEVIIMRYVRL
jgi:hypothetical protein